MLLFALGRQEGWGTEGLQSVLENSACERLRTKTVWVRPFGQSRSLHGFFVVEFGFGMEAKGRSGREVGKCDFVKVGGTYGLDAPMARGDGMLGREYIMSGIWRVDVKTGGWRGTKPTYVQGRRGGMGGELSEQPKTSFVRIYNEWVEMDVPKELVDNTNRSSVGEDVDIHVTRPTIWGFLGIAGRVFPTLHLVCSSSTSGHGVGEREPF
jgi:hypothetical protein